MYDNVTSLVKESRPELIIGFIVYINYTMPINMSCDVSNVKETVLNEQRSLQQATRDSYAWNIQLHYFYWLTLPASLFYPLALCAHKHP